MIDEKFIVRINDLMPKSKRKHIDIVFPTKKKAYKFGIKFKKVKLIKQKHDFLEPSNKNIKKKKEKCENKNRYRKITKK